MESVFFSAITGHFISVKKGLFGSALTNQRISIKYCSITEIFLQPFKHGQIGCDNYKMLCHRGK